MTSSVMPSEKYSKSGLPLVFLNGSTATDGRNDKFSFSALDVPFLMEERTERVEKLKDIMEQSNVNVAEKFRKVMEAYQIENDYGSSSEYYTQTIPLDGAPRSFNILRVGRIGLYFQSDDTGITGRWDNTDRQWVIDNSIRNEVRKGLRMARQLIAPELIIVPVAAPTPAEAS